MPIIIGFMLMLIGFGLGVSASASSRSCVPGREPEVHLVCSKDGEWSHKTSEGYFIPLSKIDENKP